jgi:hypothetical protein
VGDVCISIDIERPVWDVWNYVTDLRHDVEWFHGVREVRVVSEVQTGVGTIYDQATRLFGWRFTARMQVTNYQPPSLMVLRALRSATPFVARYEFEELGTRPRPVTRYTLAAEVRGASAYRLLGPAFMPLLRGAVRRRLTALKLALESRPD